MIFKVVPKVVFVERYDISLLSISNSLLETLWQRDHQDRLLIMEEREFAQV